MKLLWLVASLAAIFTSMWDVVQDDYTKATFWLLASFIYYSFAKEKED